MYLYFAARTAIFIQTQFSLALCFHINFVALGNIVLVFADRANQSNDFAISFFGHMGTILA